MTDINNHCSYTANTMTVIKAPQDQYDQDKLNAEFTAELINNSVSSVTITAQGFDIVCASAIDSVNADILYQAVKSFCDW